MIDICKQIEWLSWVIDARNSIRTRENDDIYSFMDSDRNEHFAVDLIAEGIKPRKYLLRQNFLNLAIGVPVENQVPSIYGGIDRLRILFSILDDNKIKFELDEQYVDLIMKEILIKYHLYFAYKQKHNVNIKAKYKAYNSYFTVDEIIANNPNIEREKLELFLEITSRNINSIKHDYTGGIIKINDKYFCITSAFLAYDMFRMFEKYLLNRFVELKNKNKPYEKMRGDTFEMYCAQMFCMLDPKLVPIVNYKYDTGKGNQEIDVIFEYGNNIIVMECKATNYLGKIPHPYEKDIEKDGINYLGDGFVSLSRIYDKFNKGEKIELYTSKANYMIDTAGKKIYTILISMNSILSLAGEIQKLDQYDKIKHYSVCISSNDLLLLIKDAHNIETFIKYLDKRQAYFSYKQLTLDIDEIDVYYTLIHSKLDVRKYADMTNGIDSSFIIKKNFRTELNEIVNNFYFNYLLELK